MVVGQFGSAPFWTVFMYLKFKRNTALCAAHTNTDTDDTHAPTYTRTHTEREKEEGKKFSYLNQLERR